MSEVKLRIYSGPRGDASPFDVAESRSQRDTVTVPASDVLPLLAAAIRQDRTWLDEFDDDEMTIPTDLYELLLAYKFYRAPTG